MYNYDNYEIDNDYNFAHITDNISPPVVHRQNAFVIRDREINTENQIDTEINLEEIINRSIPDELDILSSVDTPSLRKIKSEYKESITIKSFNSLIPLIKFYSF